MCARRPRGVGSLFPHSLLPLLAFGVVAAALLAGAGQGGPAAADEPGWLTLFGDKDLGAWDKPAKEWLVAGDAELDPKNPKRLVPRPGTGVLVNGGKGR